MKKLLVLLLTLAMVFTMFASCSSCKEDKDGETTTKPKQTTKDPGNSEDPDDNAPDAEGFVKVEKTLYVVVETGEGILNVREKPGKNEKLLGTLSNGTAVKVIGENATLGWSRIEYNDSIAYVDSDYLKEQKLGIVEDSSFTAVNEKVYAYATGGADDTHLPDVDVKAYLHAYQSGWTDKQADYLFENYTELTRIGIYTDSEGNGWSKITYHDNDQDKDVTIFIRNSQLVTELPTGITPAQ